MLNVFPKACMKNETIFILDTIRVRAFNKSKIFIYNALAERYVMPSSCGDNPKAFWYPVHKRIQNPVRHLRWSFLRIKN